MSAYEELYNLGCVTFPQRDSSSGEYYKIVDSNGFEEEPSMIMWQRCLFNGPATGVYMRKIEKTIKSTMGYREYDYSQIPIQEISPGEYIVTTPDIFHRYQEPKYISREDYE